jgi:quinol monooxygenase YgiN
MAKTLHVIARVRAKEGQHEALKNALSLLVSPSRRELSCYQYDLLQSTTDPRSFCFVERWEGNQALERHGASDHVKRAGEQIADLIEAPPEIQRFELV